MVPFKTNRSFVHLQDRIIYPYVYFGFTFYDFHVTYHDKRRITAFQQDMYNGKVNSGYLGLGAAVAHSSKVT